MQLTTSGIVIRERRLDEEDRVLTLLTRDRGVITAYHKGYPSRRNYQAALELLSYSDFVLFYNKERYSINKADSNTIFFGIRQDMEKLALATYFAQLCWELAPAEEDGAEYLRLMLNTLYLLEKGRRPAGQLKAILELRMMTMAGYMPDLVGCAGCGAYEKDEMYFSFSKGDLLCGDCRQDGEYRRRLAPGVLAAMRHILYSQFEKLFSFTLSAEGLRQLGETVEQYLVCQLDRSIPSLDFYHSITT